MVKNVLYLIDDIYSALNHIIAALFFSFGIDKHFFYQQNKISKTLLCKFIVKKGLNKGEFFGKHDLSMAMFP